jgi:23S rRNA (pseudouridine1915-N3)-methyltransferase
MRVRLIAVGTRLPEWARSACGDYLKRLAPQLPVTVQEIAPGTRSKGAQQAVAAEGARLMAALRAEEHVAVLDERGRELTTRELAAWLKARMHEGSNLTFVIGGPDGVAASVRARADSTLSLSRLTLPHALARVLLAEQLYRAHSLLGNHPYHRE